MSKQVIEMQTKSLPFHTTYALNNHKNKQANVVIRQVVILYT